MLTIEEYHEFIEAITPPITVDILNTYTLSDAKRKLRTEAQEYADRVIKYFKKKREEELHEQNRPTK